MNLQDLLNHLNEVKSTLANGQVGQRLDDYSANFSQNLQKTLPMLKPKPTIQDIVDGGLNVGGIGAIRLPNKSGQVVYHSSDMLKDSTNMKLPFFVTPDRDFAKNMGKMFDNNPYMHSYNMSDKNNLLDIRDSINPLLEILDKAKYPYKVDGKYFNGLEEFPSVGFMQWPYPETVHDTLYIPRVREELNKAGYNGLRYTDDSMGKLYDSIVFSDVPKLKPIRTSKTDSGSKIKLRSNK